MLKRTLLLLVCLLIGTNLFSQIPNGSFENWTNGSPDSWTANNFPPDLIPVTSTTDAYDGIYAMKGEVVSYNGGAVPPNVTPSNTSGLGFPINSRYVDLTGMYKSTLIGLDVGTISILIYHSSGLSIGYGFAYLPAAANYTRFTIPISYTANYPAARAHITFSMVDSTGVGFNVGSNIIIDALELELVTNINSIDLKNLNVFPVPATSHIFLNDKSAKGQPFFAKLYNITGELILDKKFDEPFNSFPSIDINNLPEGIYELLVSDEDAKNLLTQKVVISRK